MGGSEKNYRKQKLLEKSVKATKLLKSFGNSYLTDLTIHLGSPKNKEES